MIQVKCIKCKSGFITSDYKNWKELKDDDMGYCDECGGKNFIIKVKDIREPETIIDIAEEESESDLPGELFDEISTMVDDESHLELARRIYSVFKEDE
jgi:DNA-directed RNA polymerase subunit RPC12/RpoP